MTITTAAAGAQRVESTPAAIAGGQAVPRYTSYPTAPNFTPAIDAGVQAAWLQALPSHADLSLYLHVPYCAELCHYCGCNTHATRRQEPVEQYVDDLLTEIANVARLSGARKVSRIHWGGGTPSIVGTGGFQRLYRALAKHFDLSGLAEHAIELDPRRLEKGMAATLAQIGVNRANFGVQEFSEPVQKAIGRVQPFAVVEAAVQEVRAAGIRNIGVDLMYGLPYQTLEDVQFSATLAARLTPQRVAIFGYAHVPWFKKQQRLIDEKTLPGAEARYSQALAAQKAWLDLGYVQVGIDHYVLPDDELAVAARRGVLHRNFQGYTDDACPVLIGLGASAISRFPQGYAQNHPATAAYAAEVRYGRLATVRGISLSAEDQLRAEIIERLMCDFRVDIDVLVEKHALPTIFSRELARIDLLAIQGLVRRSGRRIEIAAAGKPFARLVASVFDSYLAEKQTRHSVAV
ncbi:MAG TPA: oxygen-independent coproporphyrinogen III oxidase [Xanthobacteraceae bacterium]|nr:oxygen-independent coproporphyrinogen III oxidase [Xanthobacteraceae bacterium]